MNGAQLHLALNHFPVILSFVSVGILLWGWIGKSSEIRKVGLVLVVGTAVLAAAAFFTGEPAEDVLKLFPSFPKPLVHEHEEAGEAAFIVSIVAGVCAIAALFLTKRKPKLSGYAFLLCILITLLSSLSFLRTAHLGGLVRHEEIRSEK